MRHWVGKRENQHFQWVTCFYNWKKLPSETQSSSAAAAEWMQNVSSSPSRVEPTKSLSRAFHACAAKMIDWKYFIVNWWRFAVFFSTVHACAYAVVVHNCWESRPASLRQKKKWNEECCHHHSSYTSWKLHHSIGPVSRHLCRFSSLSRRCAFSFHKHFGAQDEEIQHWNFEKRNIELKICTNKHTKKVNWLISSLVGLHNNI